MARLHVFFVHWYSREQRPGSARGLPPVSSELGPIPSVLAVPVFLGCAHAIIGCAVSAPVQAWRVVG